MAIYSFKIKKGIFQLDLSTSDKELVVEQFEKWVKEATAYAKKRKAATKFSNHLKQHHPL